jgi:hypothetical protein
VSDRYTSYVLAPCAGGNSSCFNVSIGQRASIRGDSFTVNGANSYTAWRHTTFPAKSAVVIKDPIPEAGTNRNYSYVFFLNAISETTSSSPERTVNYVDYPVNKYYWNCITADCVPLADNINIQFKNGPRSYNLGPTVRFSSPNVTSSSQNHQINVVIQ